MCCGMRLHSRLLMTCLESFVRFAEINQWPLDVIARIHVHVRDRKTHRHQDTKRDNKTDRQTDRQTDKQKHWYMSHPFSLFPFHAEPGLTRPWSFKPSFLSAQKGAKVRLPCSKDDNFIGSVFLTFQLSKGTIFEMPHCVLTVFSQYKLAFLNMIA